ncbi:hypothetical protein EBR57_10205 [bacterium]|nr:hypothetical protein [bacterium]
MRLYHGDDINRTPRQYEAKPIGYNFMCRYNPRTKTWACWEVDAVGNPVPQLNGEIEKVFSTKSEMVNFVFGM